MTRLTIPQAGTNPGRAARAGEVVANGTGAALAGLGNVVADIGIALRRDKLDREMKRAQVDLTRDVNALRLEVEQIGNPDLLEATWQQGVTQLRNRYTQADPNTGQPPIDPENAEPFGLMFDQLTNATGFDIGRRALTLRNSERQASWLSYAHEATTAAAQANPQMRAAILQHGDDQLAGLVATGVIDAAEAERRRQGLRQNVDNERAIRMLSDDPAGFIAAAQGGAFDGLPGDVVARYEVQAQNALQRATASAQADAERMAREQQARADAKLRDMRQLALAGRGVADEAFLQMPAAQASDEYRATLAAFQLRDEIPELHLKTPGELVDLIAEERAKDLDAPYQLERLTVLETLLAEHQAGYGGDPMAYAIRQHDLKEPAIDWTADSAQLTTQLARRGAIAQQLVAGGYTPDGRALTNADTDALREVLASDDPAERLRVATTLTGTLGDATLGAVTDDLALRHAAEYASAGNAPGVALDIVRGQAALDAQNVRLPPLPERLGESFDVLDAVFANLPTGDAMQERVLRAADALYARRMGRVDPAGDIDQKRYAQALHEVMGGTGAYGRRTARGGIGEVRGTQTALPAGLSADDAEQALDRLGRIRGDRAKAITWDASTALDQLALVGGGALPMVGNAPLDARTWRRLVPVAVGDDQYVLMRPAADPDAPPQVARTETGAPYTFSLRALYQLTQGAPR